MQQRKMVGAVSALILGAILWTWPGLSLANEPFARANRLAIGLSFGLGSASLGSYHEAADAVTKLVE
ncbi:MAG: hypothetical protein V1754_15985, partial [Pseudomonadota bacterium]